MIKMLFLSLEGRYETVKNRKSIALGLALALSISVTVPTKSEASVQKEVLKIVAEALVEKGLEIAVENLKEFDRSSSSSGNSEGLPILNQRAKTLLDSIQNLSELSTYEVKYNGIATATENVMEKELVTNILYYVNYSATVKMGIDFSEIEVYLSEEDQVVVCVLPDVKVTDLYVNSDNLQFLFIDESANTGTVYASAHQLCVEQLKKESAGFDEMKKFAKENAENLIEAITLPLLKQSGSEIQFVIV